MKELQITIEGNTCSGKSTIARHIADSLSELGIDVRLEDELLAPSWPFRQEERLGALRDVLRVRIQTKQINRSASDV